MFSKPEMVFISVQIDFLTLTPAVKETDLSFPKSPGAIFGFSTIFKTNKHLKLAKKPDLNLRKEELFWNMALEQESAANSEVKETNKDEQEVHNASAESDPLDADQKAASEADTLPIEKKVEGLEVQKPER